MKEIIQVRRRNSLGHDVLVGEAENEATAEFVIAQLTPIAAMFGYGLYGLRVEVTSEQES